MCSLYVLLISAGCPLLRDVVCSHRLSRRSCNALWIIFCFTIVCSHNNYFVPTSHSEGTVAIIIAVLPKYHSTAYSEETVAIIIAVLPKSTVHDTQRGYSCHHYSSAPEVPQHGTQRGYSCHHYSSAPELICDKLFGFYQGTNWTIQIFYLLKKMYWKNKFVNNLIYQWRVYQWWKRTKLTAR